jgi:Flp pilus assembly protein TadD
MKKGMRLRAKLFSACIFLISCTGISPAAPEELPELAHARALLNQGKFQDAEAVLRSFLSGHLASADARFLLAYTLFRENKPRESLAEYTHAAQLQRPTAEDLHNVALDYVLLNDYTDADTWMTRATEWSPANGEYWYDLGRIKATENRFSDAVHCFTQSLKYQPRSVKAENNLGIAYEGLNRTDDAIAAYRQAIAWASDAPALREGSPDSAAQPMLQLATILTDRGQLTEAQTLLEKAAVLEPHDARIHKALGLLYERKGELAASQRAFEDAVSESPQDASLHFQLGTVYRKRGLREQAQSEFARAAQLNGTHSTPTP